MDESQRSFDALDSREAAALQRLARLYAAKNQISRIIARVPPREALFQQICTVLVDTARFRMAWIGWHDPAAARIDIVARYGAGSEELLARPVSVAPGHSGGPTARAFLERRPVICHDLLTDPDTAAWRDEIERRGLRSAAAFPVLLEQGVCATLSVYSVVTGHFEEEETALLAEAAADLAFALENLAREAERHDAHVRIGRLNRTYALLSAVNKVIAHEPASDVLQAICDVAVSVGGFRMAWVGMADPDGRGVTPVASAGAVGGFLEGLTIDRQDPARRDGPTVRAFATGQHVLCNDIANDAGLNWRARALGHGYRSSGAFPIVKNGATIAVFKLYSADVGFFDDEEARLLDELAVDLGFALEVHDRELERRRIEGLLRQSETNLRESIAELRAVTQRLYEIKEEERARLARDLHDHLGQALTVLKMDVAEIGRRLDSGSLTPVRERLGEMSRLIDDAVRDVRRVAAALRPAMLEELGLIEAIRLHLQEVERRGGPACALRPPLTAMPIRKDLALVAFRILQEAMTNVLRHAGATRVDVLVDLDEGAVLQLVIRDNGCGLPPPDGRRAKTLGLVGMRDRARLVDGDVTIASAPGAGTTVTARIPLEGPG